MIERAGNIAEALRVYESLRTRLREELGTALAAQAQALHRRLLRDEPAVATETLDAVP